MSLSLSDKDIYREWCINNDSISVFMQPWFMDVASGEDNWEVILSKDKNGIAGALIYAIQRKFFFTYCRNPSLSYVNLWLSSDNQPAKPTYKRLMLQSKVLPDLLNQVPVCSMHMQFYPYTIENLFPIEKNKYTIEAVTHLKIDLQTDWRKDVKPSVWNNAKNAEKDLTIETTTDLEKIYELYAQTLKRFGKNPLFSFEKFTRLHTAIQLHKAGECYQAVDKNGHVHAVLYLIWDKNSVYYWIPASDEQFKGSNAMTFLLVKILTDATNKNFKQFYFKGSTHESLLHFKASFGAKTIIYYKVTRFSNIFFEFIYKTYKILRNR